ncbi:hypothetical protein HZ994_09620 [Akkermansiaceae bacterium]|nr:hypothetical protein HZ994_09620 [Akkermansiaceae bacterium]
MRILLAGIAALLLATPLASARFSERKLESSMASASKSGKLVAFVFYQGYALPNCPKCISSTNANNKAIKSAIPRSDVVVIEVEPGDKDLDKLPAAVGGAKRGPAIVVTDAMCEKVVAKIDGAPDREKAKEFKAAVEEARGEG